jgi:hypothetical protein
MLERIIDLYENTTWGKEYLKQYWLRLLLFSLVFSIVIGLLFESLFVLVIVLSLMLFIYLLQANFKPLKWAAKKNAKSQLKFKKKGSFNTLLEPSFFEITDTHLIVEGNHFKSEMEWNFFESVKMTDDYIFIYNFNLSSLIIPRNSFESEAEFEDFFNTISNLV